MPQILADDYRRVSRLSKATDIQTGLKVMICLIEDILTHRTNDHPDTWTRHVTCQRLETECGQPVVATPGDRVATVLTDIGPREVVLENPAIRFGDPT